MGVPKDNPRFPHGFHLVKNHPTRMKILHVEGGRNLYGGAHQILLLMKGLRRRGIHNVLACRVASELAEAGRPIAEVHALKWRGISTWG